MNKKQRLQNSRDNKWCLRLKTRNPDGDAYDGIVTHITKEYVVIREESSFEFDGVVVLPTREIRGMRDGKYERCANDIIRQNGCLDGLMVPAWLDGCQTLEDVTDALRRTDTWPAVEVVYRGRTRSALYLGPIARATKKHLVIRCYDAAGEWEGEYRLAYDKIVKMEFDSAYCRHFNAYMRSRDATELAVAPDAAQPMSQASSRDVAPRR